MATHFMRAKQRMQAQMKLGQALFGQQQQHAVTGARRMATSAARKTTMSGITSSPFCGASASSSTLSSSFCISLSTFASPLSTFALSLNGSQIVVTQQAKHDALEPIIASSSSKASAAPSSSSSSSAVSLLSAEDDEEGMR